MLIEKDGFPILGTRLYIFEANQEVRITVLLFMEQPSYKVIAREKQNPNR